MHHCSRAHRASLEQTLIRAKLSLCKALPEHGAEQYESVSLQTHQYSPHHTSYTCPMPLETKLTNTLSRSYTSSPGSSKSHRCNSSSCFLKPSLVTLPIKHKQVTEPGLLSSEAFCKEESACSCTD